ncbi:hypothetical protein BHM03_00020859 [Ensete ventricosum]|nr:hypothetical protein BHM03_00020859 [Ensete ventricosum]
MKSGSDVWCTITSIKPNSFMLDSTFNASLNVFSLARLVDHEHDMQMMTLVGTRGYMALNTSYRQDQQRV